MALRIEVNAVIRTLQICNSSCCDPYRNIATEKYLLETVAPDSCVLFLWQNQNTVVIGRNQNAWVECRTALLEQEGGHLARRLSGGGAVFHDLGNLNFTFLMHQQDYDLDRQLEVIRVACAAAGITVERSGRNDLLANGCKFSGNAFYHTHGRAYHHGTLLIDADMDRLSRYLTPSKAKLEAKGVASVRSRVINLNSLCPTLTCAQMAQNMAQAFGAVYGITPVQIPMPETRQIRDDAKMLGSWDWLYGQKLPFSVAFSDRFDWGSIELQLQVKGGQVTAAQVYSDAMDWSIAQLLQQRLPGCRFSANALCDALGCIDDPTVQADIAALIIRQEL